MARTPVKVIALLTAATAVIVLAAAAFSARGTLRERYHLWKLESGTEAERTAAAGRLGEIGGARAIRPLLRAIRKMTRLKDRGELVLDYFGSSWDLPEAYELRRRTLRFTGNVAEFPALPASLPPGAEAFADPIGKILRRTPSGAWAVLESALEEDDAEARLIAVLVLGRLLGEFEEAAPLLRRAADDPDKDVRTAAIQALLDSGKLEEMDGVLLRLKLRPPSPPPPCGAVHWSCSCEQCMPSRSPRSPERAPPIRLEVFPRDR